MTDQNKQYESLTHTYLRAETFCAALQQSGFAFDRLNIKFEGAFKKSFRNEIENVATDFNEEGLQTEMELRLNRDGLYDRLPDGIFHQTRGNSKTSSVREMTDEHRRFKEEEKQARKFFQPLEQEFFRYATLVEQEEVNFSFGILAGELRNDLRTFWGLPEGLPPGAEKRMVQVLPWASFVKGDMQLTARALEIILDQPVQATAFLSVTQKAAQAGFELGGGELGISTVAGAGVEEPFASWKFTIEGLQKKDVWQFTPGHPYGLLLSTFDKIFIPLTIDIIFDFSYFQTVQDDPADVLGFSMVL